MKLYGAIASPYVARVVMYAKIKNIDLPLAEAIGGNLKSPEYLKLNPIGKMPTLDVDGKGIGESSVICDYLEQTHPNPPGLPKDPFDRARSLLVARICDLYIAPTFGPLFRNMNPAARDNAAMETTGKDIAKTYGYAEHAMGSGPFCVGATPTFGDCALGPATMMLKKMLAAGKFDVEDPVGTPRLAQWWKAMESHPVCSAVLKDYSTAFDNFVKAMAARTAAK
jgi:glutathione S-transferase